MLLYILQLLAALLILWVLIFRGRAGRLASAADLTFDVDGLHGTIDGRPAFVRWADITSVRDAGDTMVVLRRGNAFALAIPKGAIGDAGAAWAELEQRLTSQRGLVRSAIPRSVIVNTVPRNAR